MEFSFIADITGLETVDILAKIYNLLLCYVYIRLFMFVMTTVRGTIRKGIVKKWKH